LAALADCVLVEADGSRGLPVKAHLSHEPAIPEAAALTVVLTGASGFGRPIREAVHRWERFCQLTGASPEEPVTAEGLAALLMAEGFGDLIFVNQAETPERLSEAERLAGLLDRPVFAGTLKGGIWKCLS
ncbi:MAG: putative selenium-dependent hydroxylase accessory protein YqeC, partial [Oscillospiraceae bacterium]|nr:putative selenium-dependent hydroxylase accessory protein YqeC [Oscillospiraceae bacterium]